MNRIRIGNLNIELNGAGYPMKNDNLTDMFIYCSECTEKDILFDVCEMNPDWFSDTKCVQYTGGYELLRTERGLFMMNHWARCRYGYGVWLDDLKKGDRVPVYFNPAMHNQIPITIVRLLSTIGLHSKLLQRGASVIHASFVGFKGKGILFTAPAGTGKSTQADLWKRYEGAEIINGDRVLVRKFEDRWYGFGYPCCGSSYICENKEYPIQAIVLLEQGTENRIESVPASRKISALTSATEIYPWDMDEVDLAFQLAAQITAEVPVIKLICRPDQEAVEVLRNFLEDNDNAKCI